MQASTVVITIAALAMAPITAQAQRTTSSKRFSIAGHVEPVWDDAQSNRIGGGRVEGGLSFGLGSPIRGIEVDVSASGWRVKQSAPRRFQYAGKPSGFEQTGHLYETSLTVRHRSMHVGVLYTRHAAVTPAWTVSWSVGGAFFYRAYRQLVVTNEVLPGDTLVEVRRDDGRSTRNYIAAQAGLDAALRVSKHWAVVPRIRLTVFPNLGDDAGFAPRPMLLSPQVAVRGTF
jgi:hypothetical protein